MVQLLRKWCSVLIKEMKKPSVKLYCENANMNVSIHFG